MTNRRLIETKEWRETIEIFEIHDQGLADTLAIEVDPDLQNFLKESEKDVNNGSLVPLDEA